MKYMPQHNEWLSMVEVSGPFLAVSVLEKIFPQGLESLETYEKKRLCSAYDEWRDAVEEDDPQLAELHLAWNEMVLRELLEYDDTVLHRAEDDYIYNSPDGNGRFSPDFVLRSGSGSDPLLFLSILPEGTDLEKVKVGDGWPVPIFERMMLLCRNKGVRLGLITNGERWMIVNAPVGNTSSHISWYARLWFQEPATLKAFQTLLNVRRWFGPEAESLSAMLEESLQQHEEVTDTLGEQVKRAVEVLIQCLDKADQDRNRELLHDVLPAELYEAGLTVMMRLVFVLCAEERGLLLLGDSIYDQYYAISTLRGQLAEDADQHGYEVLERRHDAWTRLLAVFRALFGGIEHESLRMPALGGSLFDPDRFPFLEGRAKGTLWKETPSQPIPIDNRTVLLLLEALQVLEQRGGALLLSYKALDIEQIGQIYEGLLEHTVCRLTNDTLGLVGSQKAKYPNIGLIELESARLVSTEFLISVVETTTSRSKSAISAALNKEVDDVTFGKIVMACGGDMELANRLKSFAHLLRTDAWGDFIVYRANSFAVTLGADRRETGTHYTPKSLTESIVENTLEPVAYVGPAEGKPREEWQLKSSTELLDLKICDPAMGSGAFLVQVCRWLSERVVEAWGKEEENGKFVTVDGIARESVGSDELLTVSLDDRILFARRLVAEKCLYGVDLNPLAVELAKLSIWLITLAKGRPFGFVDHNIRSGDSLLGLHSLDQLNKFSLQPERDERIFKFAGFEQSLAEALALRKRLRNIPIRDIRDVQHMQQLDQLSRQKLEYIEHIADAMIGQAMASDGNKKHLNSMMEYLAGLSSSYIEGNNEIGRKIICEARSLLSIDLPVGKPPRRPFHWILEFPEVFEQGGFDGIVSNPPFMGGRSVRSNLGGAYRDFIYSFFGNAGGNTDLCCFFILRSDSLLKRDRVSGLITTKTSSEGDSRQTAFVNLLSKKRCIFRANSGLKWPGRAAVMVNITHLFKGEWKGFLILNGRAVNGITADLEEGEFESEPQILKVSKGLCFQGSLLRSDKFFISDIVAKELLDDEKCNDVVFPYMDGDDLNSSPNLMGSRWVIDFKDYPLSKAKKYSKAFSIIEKNVYPDRMTTEKDRDEYSACWWRFWRPRTELYNKLQKIKEAIVITRHTKYLVPVFVKTNQVFSDALVIFPTDSLFTYGVLNSIIFESWARLRSGSLGVTLRFTPSDCLETFPFPELNSNIEDVAFRYKEAIMQTIAQCGLGLTEIFNRFNEKENLDINILKLREIYSELNLTIGNAYGWNDIDFGHGFYETRQGTRFTISEETRHEVLKRLLKLNHRCCEEEISEGVHDQKKTSTTIKKKTYPVIDDGNFNMFDLINILSGD